MTGTKMNLLSDATPHLDFSEMACKHCGQHLTHPLLFVVYEKARANLCEKYKRDCQIIVHSMNRCRVHNALQGYWTRGENIKIDFLTAAGLAKSTPGALTDLILARAGAKKTDIKNPQAKLNSIEDDFKIAWHQISSLASRHIFDKEIDLYSKAIDCHSPGIPLNDLAWAFETAMDGYGNFALIKYPDWTWKGKKVGGIHFDCDTSRTKIVKDGFE